MVLSLLAYMLDGIAVKRRRFRYVALTGSVNVYNITCEHWFKTSLKNNMLRAHVYQPRPFQVCLALEVCQDGLKAKYHDRSFVSPTALITMDGNRDEKPTVRLIKVLVNRQIGIQPAVLDPPIMKYITKLVEVIHALPSNKYMAAEVEGGPHPR